ncbi:hypothetical protein LOY34_18145 [Pseudomonas sp. B21-009]|uniref:DUF7079 family protein n=1 Tax=Pseudomonas sp. B21-009 TaxID=2895470 RepID=UPI00215DDA19|nr:hypothetical protein [Pseudomonas sp. B21-009]UVM65247.1 hypothetical protein LOY34_18145 [Pseudomonas sp. B21-009]
MTSIALEGTLMTPAPHMTPQQRQQVRAAMSDAFVDTHVEYLWIARHLVGFDRELLKEIFYSEVAPACYGNIMTPVPPVWTGFDETWLQEEIEETLQARRDSWWRRHIDRLLNATWVWFFYKEIWADILLALDEAEAEQQRE